MDGRITGNDLCMQIQADVLGVDGAAVVAETTTRCGLRTAGLAVEVLGGSVRSAEPSPAGEERTSGGHRRGTTTACTAGLCRLAERCSGPWIGLTCHSFRCA